MLLYENCKALPRDAPPSRGFFIFKLGNLL